VALSHDTLYNFYKLNFALMQYHKYSITDIEQMMPFEREIYVVMIVQMIKEEKLRRQQQQNNQSVIR